MAFEAATESMVGLLPVAMAGGITLGLTKEALKIPGQVSGGWEAPESPKERMRRKKRERRDMSSSLWGPPPSGIF